MNYIHSTEGSILERGDIGIPEDVEPVVLTNDMIWLRPIQPPPKPGLYYLGGGIEAGIFWLSLAWVTTKAMDLIYAFSNLH